MTGRPAGHVPAVLFLVLSHIACEEVFALRGDFSSYQDEQAVNSATCAS